MDSYNKKEELVLVDDGMGERIKIPSIFIGYKYGELLKNYLQAGKSLSLAIEFEENKYPKSNYKFWIYLPSLTTNNLIHSFDKVRHKLNKEQCKSNIFFLLFSLNKKFLLSQFMTYFSAFHAKKDTLIKIGQTVLETVDFVQMILLVLRTKM